MSVTIATAAPGSPDPRGDIVTGHGRLIAHARGGKIVLTLRDDVLSEAHIVELDDEQADRYGMAIIVARRDAALQRSQAVRPPQGPSDAGPNSPP